MGKKNFENTKMLSKFFKNQSCTSSTLYICTKYSKTFDLYDEESILLKEVNESFPLPLPTHGFDNVMQQPKYTLESTFKLLKILTYHKIYVLFSIISTNITLNNIQFLYLKGIKQYYLGIAGQ